MCQQQHELERAGLEPQMRPQPWATPRLKPVRPWTEDAAIHAWTPDPQIPWGSTQVLFEVAKFGVICHAAIEKLIQIANKNTVKS